MSSCGLMSEAEKSQKNGRIIQKAPKIIITYLIISRRILIAFFLFISFDTPTSEEPQYEQSETKDHTEQ